MLNISCFLANTDALAEVSNEATPVKGGTGSALSTLVLGERAIGTLPRMLIGDFNGGMADTLPELRTTRLTVVMIGLGGVTPLSYALDALAWIFFDTGVSNVVIVNVLFDIIARAVNSVNFAIGILADVDLSIWWAVIHALALMALPASNK